MSRSTPAPATAYATLQLALGAAFAELEREHGYLTRQDFVCCGPCGSANMQRLADEAGQTPGKRRYVTYNGQSTDDLYETPAGEKKTLYLQWAGAGRKICAVLRKHGLEVSWSGSKLAGILVESSLPLDERVEEVYEDEDDGCDDDDDDDDAAPVAATGDVDRAGPELTVADQPNRAAKPAQKVAARPRVATTDDDDDTFDFGPAE